MADQIVYHIAFCKKLCLAVYISFNNFVETVFRDAHQSLLATRMSTEQMLPIVEKMDRVGYHAVECWGGATFDTALRFLKEDPWSGFGGFGRDLSIRSCRCFCGGRICWGTAIIWMMWWIISAGNRWQMGLTKSVLWIVLMIFAT